MPTNQESRTSGTISFGFQTGSNRLGHGQNSIGTQGQLHFVFGIGNLAGFAEIRTTSPEQPSPIQEARTSGSTGIGGSGLFGLLLFGQGNFGNQVAVNLNVQATQETRTSGTA